MVWYQDSGLGLGLDLGFRLSVQIGIRIWIWIRIRIWRLSQITVRVRVGSRIRDTVPVSGSTMPQIVGVYG